MQLLKRLHRSVLLPQTGPMSSANGNTDTRNLKDRAIRGSVAKLFSQGANFTVRIGTIVVLSRLLDPKDFGLVGMVTAMTGVLNLFHDFGLSTATVQRREVTNQQLSTFFWINIFIGSILGCACLLSAPVMAAFYKEPRLLTVTAVLAAGFLLNAAGVQHSALLSRQLRFTTLAAIEVTALMSSSLVGVGMAFLGYGYWSLVGMTITSPAVSTICAWFATSWMPAWPRREAELGSMMRFGGTLTLNGVVVYLAYNLDKVLLGRYWGADAVGLYGRAFNIINIPTANLNDSVGGVAFAALSRLQNDLARFRSYFLKGYGFVLALTAPVTFGCAVFGADLVLVLLGPKWKDATTIFRLLAPTILVFALINPLAWLLFSLGLVGRSLKLALVIAPLTIGSYALGLSHGPQGVALAYSTAMLLWVVPHMIWCVHGTAVSFRDLVQALGRPLLSALLAAAVAEGAVLLWAEAWTPLARLLLGGTVLVVVYLATLMYAMGQKQFYVNLFKELVARRQPSAPENVTVSA
jgi:O-antigen/teichoic acid export membrane protein